MAGMDKKAPAVTTGQGVDVITAIDTKANKLTIQHRPILAVGWPAMTMAFKGHSADTVRACDAGDQVGCPLITTLSATAQLGTI